jgi:hypothetical protein
MYHLLKARNNSLSELKSPITGDKSAISGKSADIDKVSYNYFTKAILNNRIKNGARQ